VIRRLLITLALVAAAAILGFGLLAWRSEIDAVSPAKAGSFGAELIQRGAHLAAIGNCISCHTLQNGETLAGGVPITFDETRITSIDWSTYPILRFQAVPETIEVQLSNVRENRS